MQSEVTHWKFGMNVKLEVPIFPGCFPQVINRLNSSEPKVTWLWPGSLLKLRLPSPSPLQPRELSPLWLYPSRPLPFTAQPFEFPATLLKLLPTAPVGLHLLLSWYSRNSPLWAQPVVTPSPHHRPLPSEVGRGWVGLNYGMRAGIHGKTKDTCPGVTQLCPKGNMGHLSSKPVFIL